MINWGLMPNTSSKKGAHSSKAHCSKCMSSSLTPVRVRIDVYKRQEIDYRHGNYFKCNVDLERLSAAFFSHRQFRFQNPDPGNLLCQNAFRAIWKSLGINFSRSLSFHHSYHHRLFISAKILCQGRIRRRSENVEITVP